MPGIGYEIIEVTSSGLTHTCDKNLLGFCKIGLYANTP